MPLLYTPIPTLRENLEMMRDTGTTPTSCENQETPLRLVHLRRSCFMRCYLLRGPVGTPRLSRRPASSVQGGSHSFPASSSTNHVTLGHTPFLPASLPDIPNMDRFCLTSCFVLYGPIPRGFNNGGQLRHALPSHAAVQHAKSCSILW